MGRRLGGMRFCEGGMAGSVDMEEKKIDVRFRSEILVINAR